VVEISEKGVSPLQIQGHHVSAPNMAGKSAEAAIFSEGAGSTSFVKMTEHRLDARFVAARWIRASHQYPS
jgi:hypothetical protein